MECPCEKYSDFDVRNYGYSSLSRFIEDLDNFELKRNHTSIQVILKNDAKEVEQFMVDTGEKRRALQELILDSWHKKCMTISQISR